MRFGGKSFVTAGFWDLLGRLTEEEQEQARKVHKRWLENPNQNGLRFKKVHASRPIYSVRVSRNVRVLGTMSGDDMVWFWIGPHDEYDALLRRK